MAVRNKNQNAMSEAREDKNIVLKQLSSLRFQLSPSSDEPLLELIHGVSLSLVDNMAEEQSFANDHGLVLQCLHQKQEQINVVCHVLHDFGLWN